jgi:hypothetical protein
VLGRECIVVVIVVMVRVVKVLDVVRVVGGFGVVCGELMGRLFTCLLMDSVVAGQVGQV